MVNMQAVTSSNEHAPKDLPGLKIPSSPYNTSHQPYLYPATVPVGTAIRSMFPLASELMATKPISRRTKRMVPNEAKDERYWEKRKRNNDAARRSRENKRQIELDMRARMVYLEEENSLLRKEITVLKTKYSLSPESRYLSMDENGELVGSCLSTSFSALEEAISSTLTAKVSDNGDYPRSVSPVTTLSLSTSNGDVEGSSSDDYMPMKKRRRPKMEAEMSYSASSSSSGSSMSPSESIGNPHYPPSSAQQQSFPPAQREFYGVEHRTTSNDSNQVPRQKSSGYPSQQPSSAFSSLPSPGLGYPHQNMKDLYHNSFPATKSSPPHHPDGALTNGYHHDSKAVIVPQSPPIYAPHSNPAGHYNHDGKHSDMGLPKPEDHSDGRGSDSSPENRVSSSVFNNYGGMASMAGRLPSLSISRQRSQEFTDGRVPCGTPERDESAVHRENEAIRNQLQQLSAEVERMKSYVLNKQEKAE